MKQKLFLPMILFILLATACTPVATSTATSATEGSIEPINITVSILPQKYFVERIGGNLVRVSVMVQPGESPATYEPKPEQMTALSNADVYISIGVPFEKTWLEKFQAANTSMKMVDTTQGIDRRATPDGGFDPHIWLSPSLVKIQSETIYSVLAALEPTNEGIFKANLDAFISDIDDLDASIRATLEQTKSKKFIVFHPAWGYFAQDYGLEMISVEVGGQEPSAQELAALIDQAKAENIKVIFAQPEFSQEDAKTIANEIGGEVILINSLNPDWLNNLNTVAETFANVLGK